jgi:hypothetical protein
MMNRSMRSILNARAEAPALLLVALLAASAIVGCSSQEPAAAAAAPAASAQTLPGPQTQTPPAPQSWEEALGVTGANELAADYERQCASEETPSEDCEILRSLLVAEVVTALELTERSGDQRGTEEALAALDLADEPDIVIAAGRILGRFPDTPGIAAKALPLLRNPYVEIQRVAAELLRAGPDPGLAEVAWIWLTNHGGASGGSVYDEYPDLGASYKNLGFPTYPGAEWFSPADSDRSIGFSTKESVATVTRWFADSLKSPAIGVEQWIAERNAAVKLPDQSKMARMQQLVEKVVKGDQAARAELETLQKEFESQQRNVERAAQQSVAEILPPSATMAEARWIVAQRKEGRVSRVVLVYPLKGLQRTAIQVAWDLTDYPSAWPTGKN